MEADAKAKTTPAPIQNVSVPPAGHEKIIETSFRDDLMEAYRRAGGVDYLVRFAEASPAKFVAACVRSLPMQIQQKGTVVVEVRYSNPNFMNYGKGPAAEIVDVEPVEQSQRSHETPQAFTPNTSIPFVKIMREADRALNAPSVCKPDGSS